MKFGRLLRISLVPEWRDYYVSYRRCKRILRSVAPTPEDDVSLHEHKREDPAREHLIGTGDLDRINMFFPTQIGTLEHDVERMEEDARSAVESVDRNRLRELEKKVLATYVTVVNLQDFQKLNHEGFRKILKKYDKACGSSESREFLQRVETSPFYTSTGPARLRERLSRIHVTMTGEGAPPLAVLKSEFEHEEKHRKVFVWNVRFVLLAFALAAVALLVPALPHDAHAHRCLALLAYVTVMWTTEAVPFFASALSIPFLVIMMRILRGPEDASGVRHDLSAEDAAVKILSSMVDHVIFLVLGGFTIGKAFEKYRFAHNMASALQRKFGLRPKIFLFAVMVMAFLLSSVMSNVAAPVLVVSVLQPIMEDLPMESPYARALLLGVAFACNVGGMATPIASPQNAIAIQAVENITAGKVTVGFLPWMGAALPLCVVALLFCAFIVVLYTKPDDISEVPAIPIAREKFGRPHYIVIAVSVVTIMLWSTLKLTESTLGDLGSVALLPVMVFFGTGILRKEDFNSFQWHLIFLIAGGNALSFAIKDSQLLSIVVNSIRPFLVTKSSYVVLLVFLPFVATVTSVVSHTVSALILMPLIADVGNEISDLQPLVLASVIMTSGSMVLPMTSFPNVNSLLQEDDYGRPYLHVRDFVIAGSIFTLFMIVLLITLGYPIINGVL